MAMVMGHSHKGPNSRPFPQRTRTLICPHLVPIGPPALPPNGDGASLFQVITDSVVCLPQCRTVEPAGRPGDGQGPPAVGPGEAAAAAVWRFFTSTLLRASTLAGHLSNALMPAKSSEGSGTAVPPSVALSCT